MLHYKRSRATLACGMIGALALLALGGCSSASTASHTGTSEIPTSTLIPPTATPLSLSIQTVNVGGFQASRVIAGSRGLLLEGPGIDPNHGTPGSGIFYPNALSFYSFTTQQLTPVVTAGAQGQITGANYAGDWISYEAGNNNGLWVYNLNSGQRTQIAGDDMATKPPFAMFPTWFVNTTVIVWSTNLDTYTAPTTPSALYDYNFATGQTKTVLTSTTQQLDAEAVNATELLYSENTLDSNGTPVSGSTWLQPLMGGAPTQIDTQTSGWGGMNANYAFWSGSQGSNAQLYDLQTNQLYPVVSSCPAPVLDDAGPYALCDTSNGGATILHLPDGANVSLTSSSVVSPFATFYNGKGYFVNKSDNSDVGPVESFSLPQQ